jgi:SulP family sulfate permease
VHAYRVFGSLFFGSVSKIEALMDPKKPLPEVVVLEMHQVINMDTTGLDALETLLQMLRKKGGTLVVAEPTEQPMSLMRRSGFVDHMGEENVFDDLDDALRTLRVRHGGPSAHGAAPEGPEPAGA